MLLPSLVGIVAVALKEIYKLCIFQAELSNIFDITINATITFSVSSLVRKYGRKTRRNSSSNGLLLGRDGLALDIAG